MRPLLIVCACTGLFLLRGFNTSVGSPSDQQSSAAAPGDGSDPTLAIEEKDAYEIYSILLRTEVPWEVKAWTIQQRTDRGRLPLCIQPTAEQTAIYRPVIEDFQQKNEKQFLLQRQFDLPVYDLVDRADRVPVREREVLFEVSAVGFNPDHSRALVYVAHYCGRLCGGGSYHLMVKEKGQWSTDRGFRGAPPCRWKS